MTESPQEYVTLQVPNKGVYPNLANKNCRGVTEAEKPEKTGMSIFNKIRVDIEVCKESPVFTASHSISTCIRVYVLNARACLARLRA